MIHHHVRSFGQNKIIAIKLVRELTQLGLREAKDLVEGQGGFFITADSATQTRIANEARAIGIEFDPPLGGTTMPTTTVTTMPTAAWSESGGYTLRYVAGSAQLIPAIKLIRELTGFSLSEAKLAAEQGSIVRSNLSRSEAEQIVRRFLEIDGQVEVLQPGTSTSSTATPRTPTAAPRTLTPSTPTPSTPTSSGRKHDYENEDDYDF